MPRNNEDFTNGQEKLDATVRSMGLGKDMIKDPESGTVYLDLPEGHDFWKPMSARWDEEDKKNGSK